MDGMSLVFATKGPYGHGGGISDLICFKRGREGEGRKEGEKREKKEKRDKREREEKKRQREREKLERVGRGERERASGAPNQRV